MGQALKTTQTCLLFLIPAAPSSLQAASLLFQGTSWSLPASQWDLKKQCSGYDFQAWFPLEGCDAAGNAVSYSCTAIRVTVSQAAAENGTLG